MALWFSAQVFTCWILDKLSVFLTGCHSLLSVCYGCLFFWILATLFILKDFFFLIYSLTWEVNSFKTDIGTFIHRYCRFLVVEVEVSFGSRISQLKSSLKPHPFHISSLISNILFPQSNQCGCEENQTHSSQSESADKSIFTDGG